MKLMIAGGATPVSTLLPSNITLSHNYITHRLSWRGGPHIVKNNLELKGVVGLMIDKNVIENMWYAAQNGASIVLTPRTNYGTIPQSRIENVTFTNNIVRHAGTCVLLGIYDDQSTLPISQLIPSNHLTFQKQSLRGYFPP